MSKDELIELGAELRTSKIDASFIYRALALVTHFEFGLAYMGVNRCPYCLVKENDGKKHRIGCVVPELKRLYERICAEGFFFNKKGRVSVEDLIAVMGTTNGKMFEEAAKTIIKESESK